MQPGAGTAVHLARCASPKPGPVRPRSCPASAAAFGPTCFARCAHPAARLAVHLRILLPLFASQPPALRRQLACCCRAGRAAVLNAADLARRLLRPFALQGVAAGGRAGAGRVWRPAVHLGSREHQPALCGWLGRWGVGHGAQLQCEAEHARSWHVCLTACTARRLRRHVSRYRATWHGTCRLGTTSRVLFRRPVGPTRPPPHSHPPISILQTTHPTRPINSTHTARTPWRAGLIINAINCLPAGELDGGRVFLGLCGRRAASRMGAGANRRIHPPAWSLCTQAGAPAWSLGQPV